MPKQNQKHSHGEFIELPIDLIVPNTYNPNEMTDEEFKKLSDNVDEFEFLMPILVVPVKNGMYEIVDGEHRFEAQRLRDITTIPCIICARDKVDELRQRVLTIRMNVIKGSFNKEKFRAVVESLLESEEYTVDTLGEELGFAYESEFEKLWQHARSNLDDPDMRKEFDSAREQTKTVDQLADLLNRLFTKYGSTLDCNFMFLEFGRKESVWVQVKNKKEWQHIKNAARLCREKGYTFDSVICKLLSSELLGDWIDDHRIVLTKKSEDEPDYIFD